MDAVLRRRARTAAQAACLELLGIALGCAALTALLTGVLVPQLGDRSWDLTYASTNPLVIAMSLCIFSYGLTFRLKIAPATALVRRLSPLTFGIFLVHPLGLVILF